MSGIEELPRQVFALGWEQDPRIEQCAHDWHSIPYRAPGDVVDFVEGCRTCGAPRCGSGTCTDRRHHRGVHIYEDGSFEPIGGYLPEEPTP